jgi:hypothetical protein
MASTRKAFDVIAAPPGSSTDACIAPPFAGRRCTSRPRAERAQA